MINKKSDLVYLIKNLSTQIEKVRKRSNNWYNKNNFILPIDGIQAIQKGKKFYFIIWKQRKKDKSLSIDKVI